MTRSGSETVFTRIVVSKLKRMLGEAKAAEVSAELFAKLGKDKVETAEELKRVADELISRGGLTKMIGHSLMTEALLRGARP